MAAPVVLVTGATSGIGLATATALAEAGSDVIVHGRTRERADAAAEKLAAAGTPARAAVAADFADRAQVEQLAQTAEDLAVTAVVNNAGVYLRERMESPDGRELTWVTNHLHPSLLTVLLLDGLLDRGGRVVNISAVVHNRARFDLADPEFVERRYSHFHAYANSKLANLLMAQQFAHRYGTPGRLTFNAVHPGVVSTKLLLEGMQVEGHDEAAVVGGDVAALVIDPLYAMSNGEYFTGRQLATASGPGADETLGQQLFELTMTQLGFD